TSLATPSTAEYETDVYADELPTAESLAQEVIATNLVVSDRREAIGLLLDEEEEEEVQRIVPRKGDPRTSSDGRLLPDLDRMRRHRDPVPSSFVPRRSPDLGAATNPLTPSIGTGSGSLGPEAGRRPSRLRSGHEMDEGRRALGIGRQ
ncbi:MAG: hypothetical protein H8K05_19635, partial [Nitrospira sp.]|nr:hypothetical protein [Nitrospira sp.]